MPPRREFLGHDTSFLAQLAQHLVTQSRSADYIDLSHLTLVLPAARNERRTIEILTEAAVASGNAISPPRTCTVGALPELLYTPRGQLASISDRRLAWITALQELPATRLSLLAPQLEQRQDISSIAPLAATLQRLWIAELSPFLLQFSDVASSCREHISEFEASRWELMQEVFQGYLEILSRAERCDRDYERLLALKESRSAHEGKIILAACADLKPVTIELLDSVLSEIEVLINAEEQHSDGFDEWGQLHTSYWNSIEIKLPSEAVQVADGPSEQAGIAAEQLRNVGEELSVEDITLCCLDPKLKPFLEERIEAEGFSLREAQGEAILESSPVALLRATRNYLEDSSYRNFAELLRHPDLGALEVCQEPGASIHDCLALLDQHQAQYLQISQDRPFQGAHAATLNALLSLVNEFIAEFRGAARALPQWELPLLNLLQRCYGRRNIPHSVHEAYLRVCEAIAEAIGSASFGSATAGEAFYLLFEHLSAIRLPPSAIEQEIELLGWLELPLDDSDFLLIAGVNEGFVPESITGDMFLPNRLRNLLKITTDETRLARDSYIASVLAHSPGRTVFLTARRDASGESLLPSRILLRDKQQLPSRLLAAFRNDTAPYQLLPGTTNYGSTDSNIAKTIELTKVIPEAVSVTAFRDYIECPFRFYLKHVLRLESVSDDIHELEPQEFGNVMHKILARLAQSASEEILKDEDACFATLRKFLHEHRRKEYGDYVLPAVRVQFQQMELRLKDFSRWQAAHSSAGWSIHKTEFPLSSDSSILELGKEHGVLRVKGRIDRLDYHAASGRWMIIDYKTSEKSLEPKSVRKKSDGTWSDVQLPLYEYFVRKELATSEQIVLCYLNLSASSTEAHFADWDAEILAEGVEVAREAARAIKQGSFLPASESTKFPSDFDIILDERESLSTPARFR